MTIVRRSLAWPGVRIQPQPASPSRAGAAVIIIMSMTVVGTDIRTIGTKVSWFADTAARASRIGHLTESECGDAKVMADLSTMVQVSMSCSHITSCHHGHTGTRLCRWSCAK